MSMKKRVQMRRTNPAVQAKAGLNLRFVPPTDPGMPAKITGYAVTWNSINSHGERYARGAFAQSIADFNSRTEPVHMYYNHGHINFCPSMLSMRIGKWTKMVEDDTGLYVEGELTPGLRLNLELQAMLAHGTIDGLSICFFDPALDDIDVVETTAAAEAYTLIKRVRLYEISIVDEPSDQTARLMDGVQEAANTAESAADSPDQAEATAENARKLLQKLGISPRQADYLLSQAGVTPAPAAVIPSGMAALLDALPQ